MFGLITLFILGLLITGFVLALQYRRKVADLELLTARLRKEVDSIQLRLHALEGQDVTPSAAPAAERAAAVPVPVPVPPPEPVPVPVAVPVPVPPAVPVPQPAVLAPAGVAKAAPAARSCAARWCGGR